MRVLEHAKDVARALAQRSTMLYQHGAVIVKDGRIIATGRNHKNGYRWGNNDIESVHAEIDAIEGTEIRGLGNATMVVYAEYHDRQRLSRPCPNCAHILHKLGFKRVVYSTCTGWVREAI